MKRAAATLMVGAALTLFGGGVASAAEEYPPETTTPASIDVAAFSPVCQGDIPYIEYRIEVTGTDNDTATLTFLDGDGNVVRVDSGVPLSGRVIYPGASEDPQDWPGWKLNDEDMWVIDETDASWRDGLTVRVEVNPTATAQVTYPPATAACNGPEASSPPPQQSGGGGSGLLPSTGSDVTMVTLILAAGLLGSGALLVGSVRRRRGDAAS